MIPMNVEKLFSLKPGDQFRVYWCKDDDVNYRRLNYDIQTVVENDGDSIYVMMGMNGTRTK